MDKANGHLWKLLALIAFIYLVLISIIYFQLLEHFSWRMSLYMAFQILMEKVDANPF